MSNIDFQNGFAVGATATATARNVQADWNQNDSSAANFIRNKPFYEKRGEDEIYYFPESEGGAREKLNLEIGKTYTFYFEDPSEKTAEELEQIEHIDLECIQGSELPNEDLSSMLSDVPVLFLGDPSIFFADGVTEEDNAIVFGDYCIFSTNQDIWGFFSSSTIVKIDKKFLPDDIATKLEVATSNTLGGVMPTEKTDEMTQEVGVDEEGKLFTKKITGASEYSPLIHTVSCAVDDEGKIWAEEQEIPEIPEVTTTTSIEENSTDIPTAGAVYSFLESIFNEVSY